MDPVRTELVIDRLAYWYYHPREWLKKAALVNGTYLLNSPFTFQSMEKHCAYCAMLRLGLKVPKTILVPYKNPVDNVRWAYTAKKYNQSFDLDKIADELGYPMYMKPFDGGGWRGRLADQRPRRPAPGVRRVRRDADAPPGHRRLRALRPGAVDRPRDDGDELPVPTSRCTTGTPSPTASSASPPAPQTVAISRIVNAFFGWEFNSCEMLVAGDDVYPIDYANACPDVAVTSLHYYFPWAITALVRWSVFTLATGRQGRVDLHTRKYFEIADDESLSYDAKITATWRSPTSTSTPRATGSGAPSTCPHLDEQVHDWVTSADFQRLLRETVEATYPAHEQESFMAHFDGLLDLWAADNRH